MDLFVIIVINQVILLETVKNLLGIRNGLEEEGGEVIAILAIATQVALILLQKVIDVEEEDLKKKDIAEEAIHTALVIAEAVVQVQVLGAHQVDQADQADRAQAAHLAVNKIKLIGIEDPWVQADKYV